MAKRFTIHITFDGWKSRIDIEKHKARKVVLKRFDGNIPKCEITLRSCYSFKNGACIRKQPCEYRKDNKLLDAKNYAIDLHKLPNDAQNSGLNFNNINQ